LAVAVLPFLAGISGDDYLHPAALAHGFRIALTIAAVLCVCGGVLAAVTIQNPRRMPTTAPEAEEVPTEMPCLHCALDATPLAVSSSASNLSA
jgi:hypothetical protein